eukprot:COSAG06_NODE_202_length_20343_cov_59.390931_3_plen_1016_part_00
MLLLPLLLLLATPAPASAGGLLMYSPGDSHNITFDERSAIIDGTPTLMLSGAVHYTRVHEEEWERVFELAVELGLNTIQTYVFWNAHETTRDQVGNPSWDGRANLPRFIELAGKHGLWVTVRIGPYICGEYYFGGIPVWMRESGASCFRCHDPIWEREMGRWVGVVVDKIRPQLATAGGNVVMLQVENEYSGGGGAGGNEMDYLAWSVDMARNLTTAVPWNLCHDIMPCSQVNHDNDATYAAPYNYKALCTINGFWMDEYQKETYQPCPKWASDLRKYNPGQPTIWTEDQGWFDQWGVAKRVRDSRDQLYGIARFVAHGGSWHNFYMVTGGNNYAKQSGGEVVTAYAPDTVIDYLLLKHQPRFDYYSRFFHALADVSDDLMSTRTVPSPQPLPATGGGGGASANKTTTVTLGHCTDDDPAHLGRLDASQKWQASGGGAIPSGGTPFLLENEGTGLCLDPLGATKPPTLTACAAGGTKLQWTYTGEQFASVATRPCQKPTSEGEQCHVCLDVDGSSVDLWDCKTADSGNTNQQFVYSKEKQGISTGSGAAKACLTAAADGGGAEVSVYGGVAFLSNMDDASDASVTFQGKHYYLQNHSVAIVKSATGEVVFNSSVLIDPQATATAATAGTMIAADGSSSSTPSSGVASHQEEATGGGGRTVTPAPRSSKWSVYHEAASSGCAKQQPSSKGPIEQLHLTGGGTACSGYYSDYLWYTTTIPASSSGTYKVESQGAGGSILYHYIDGTPLLPTLPILHSSRYDGEGEKLDSAHVASEYVSVGSGRQLAVDNNHTETGTVTLQILSVAMGVSNGGVGPQSVKGLKSATVNGVDLTNSSWNHAWMMPAEEAEVWTSAGSAKVAWKPATETNSNSSLSWFRATFDLPAAPAAAPAAATSASSAAAAAVESESGAGGPGGPEQVSYAMDMSSAQKGVVFVNGFELGRYWITPGSCHGQCAPPIKNGHCYMHWSDCDEPTQTLYHIPTPVLKPSGNEVVFFEEQGGVGLEHLEKIQLVKLTAHP